VARVAIIDDHPISRLGLEALLTAEPSICVAASQGTADGLGELGRLDLVLLDLYLEDGHPAIGAITALAPRYPVLVMSASVRGPDVVAAMRAGASGYVAKHSSAEMVRSAVVTVLAGGFALSPQLADVLYTELGRAGSGPAPAAQNRRKPPDWLSEREEETLLWIARGYTHAQTASRMGVSKSTVDTYIARIRAKLNVGNKAELTRLAMERQAQAASSHEA
jgi:DNA-binding NarL/FixJ family response regulator